MKLKLGALALLMAAALYAGHPSCDMKEGTPCGMKSCAAIGKNGKPSGARCSRYCAKGCCFCTKACTRDYPGPNPDDESLEAGLQSGRVD